MMKKKYFQYLEIAKSEMQDNNTNIKAFGEDIFDSNLGVLKMLRRLATSCCGRMLIIYSIVRMYIKDAKLLESFDIKSKIKDEFFKDIVEGGFDPLAGIDNDSILRWFGGMTTKTNQKYTDLKLINASEMNEKRKIVINALITIVKDMLTNKKDSRKLYEKLFWHIPVDITSGNRKEKISAYVKESKKNWIEIIRSKNFPSDYQGFQNILNFVDKQKNMFGGIKSSILFLNWISQCFFDKDFSQDDKLDENLDEKYRNLIDSIKQIPSDKL